MDALFPSNWAERENSAWMWNHTILTAYSNGFWWEGACSRISFYFCMKCLLKVFLTANRLFPSRLCPSSIVTLPLGGCKVVYFTPITRWVNYSPQMSIWQLRAFNRFHLSSMLHSVRPSCARLDASAPSRRSTSSSHVQKNTIICVKSSLTPSSIARSQDHTFVIRE